jgi:serine phosphatase RsbU (regulator of sigma subunit)/CHASE2 domain-containing sensor protein
VAGVVRSGLLDSVELQGYDLLVSVHGFVPPAPELVIVDFDDATLEAIGTFPVPRGLLAEVLDKLDAGKPNLIGLDFLLSERRTPAEDQKLADAVARAGNVILADSFGTEQLPSSEPLPEFRRHALDVAFVNIPVDEDGFIRRFFLAMRTPSYSGASFPLALATNYLGQPLQRAGPRSFRLGRSAIPLDGVGPNTVLIGCWDPRPAHPIISAKRLLRDEIDARTFEGKIVLVGQSSTAGKDLYPTPVVRFRQVEGRALLSGTEIQALGVTALLTGQAIRLMGRRPLWAMNFVLILVVILAVIALRPPFSIATVGAGLVATYLLAQIMFSYQRTWIKFVSTEAGMTLALTTALAYRFVDERRLKLLAEVERLSLERELSLARTIQQSLLPESAPAIDGLDIAVRHVTSLLVGGDYYDFILLSPETLLFVVADVEGKGASSALVMSNIQATLHALLSRRAVLEDLADLVPTVNECILRNRTRKYITLFLGLLDVRTRELRYVNAGHVWPIVVRSSGDPIQLTEGGTMIGLFPGASYAWSTIQLEPGDLLLAYTDGITEANNQQGGEYESQRIVSAAQSHRECSAQQIVDAVFNDVARFSAGGDHEDDKVMMVIKVT